MKRLKLLFIMIIISSLLSSCYLPSNRNSVYYNGRKDLLVLFEYTVPFIVETANDPVGDIEICPLEEDEYGRTLGVMQFNTNYPNVIFGEDAVYCILQYGNATLSCFYEDCCCAVMTKDGDQLVTINKLKLENDWGLPVCLEKCVQIPISDYSASGKYDTHFEYDNCLTTAMAALDSKMQKPWLDVLCKDGNGKWLFAMIDDAVIDDSPVVLIMMQEANNKQDSKDSFTVIGTSYVNNKTSLWKEISEFKEDMGWKPLRLT